MWSDVCARNASSAFPSSKMRIRGLYFKSGYCDQYNGIEPLQMSVPWTWIALWIPSLHKGHNFRFVFHNLFCLHKVCNHTSGIDTTHVVASTSTMTTSSGQQCICELFASNLQSWDLHICMDKNTHTVQQHTPKDNSSDEIECFKRV